MNRTTHVFGPAYLDRVVRVDVPLHAEGRPPLDQSVDGRWTFGEGLKLTDPAGSFLRFEVPPDWPGPSGKVHLAEAVLDPGLPNGSVRVVSWHDDLGGMGAGYAAALGGLLFSALGDEDDPIGAAVAQKTREAGIEQRVIRVDGTSADWTLLISSGGHGDKLPVGFRGCHAGLKSLAGSAGPCDLRVVASLPNRLAAEALRQPGARVRVFAPAMRNVTDRGVPVSSFAPAVDVLCCNRREWEALEDREQVAWQVAVLSVTDGEHGSVVRFTTPEGESGRVTVPAFPRRDPPLDTNRAGEAYASTLVATLLDQGWDGRECSWDLARLAAERASAAAALVLDRVDFGFPTPDEVDAALRRGVVGGDADPVS